MSGRERPRERDIVFMLLQEILHQYVLQMAIVVAYIAKLNSKKRKRGGWTLKYDLISRVPDQEKHLGRIIGTNDVDCISNLRMDRRTFVRLCQVLRERGGLVNGRFVTVEEQVAMFLSVLAHHKKNRVVRFDFWRSGQTISHYIHAVLGAVIRLYDIFLAKPEAVSADCTDSRWQWFKGCLGALDGTYVNVMVGNNDKPRYRTRKGQISTNVLGVCNRNLNFIYVLSGWEGSAADSRILRDAINRPHGLKVPKGRYYLCDNGYANSEGFLTPYKGVRYHLKCLIEKIEECKPSPPQLSPHALIYAMHSLNSQLNANVNLLEVEARVDFLQDRYVCFKYLMNLPETDWDSTTNVLHADDDVWRRLFKENSFYQAYHHKGEPEYRQMSTLFGLYDVKMELSHTVIVIEDSTPCKKTGENFVDVSSDEEVTSPLLKPKPEVARKLFPEDACSSVSPAFPAAAVKGHKYISWPSISKKFAASTTSAFPQTNAFPGKPSKDKKHDNAYGGSSCASSSPFK